MGVATASGLRPWGQLQANSVHFRLLLLAYLELYTQEGKAARNLACSEAGGQAGATGWDQSPARHKNQKPKHFEAETLKALQGPLAL